MNLSAYPAITSRINPGSARRWGGTRNFGLLSNTSGRIRKQYRTATPTSTASTTPPTAVVYPPAAASPRQHAIPGSPRTINAGSARRYARHSAIPTGDAARSISNLVGSFSHRRRTSRRLYKLASSMASRQTGPMISMGGSVRQQLGLHVIVRANGQTRACGGACHAPRPDGHRTRQAYGHGRRVSN